MTSRTFTKTAAPDWLMAFWREIDDKTWGKGFDCFKEDAIANLDGNRTQALNDPKPTKRGLL